MKRTIKKLAYATCLALLLTGCNNDQNNTTTDTGISQIVVFGDSLSDGGTYHGLGLSKAGTLNGTTYSATGRFTTNPGKVWVEYLADQYHLTLTPQRFSGPGVGSNGSAGITIQGGTNYAEGGAQVTESPGFGAYQTNLNGQFIDSTGTVLSGYTIQNNQCVPTGTPVSNGLTAASLKDQIDRYLASNPQIASNVLIVLQGGSNDIIKQLYGIVNCGSAYNSTAQANIADAATQLIQQMNRLISAGAQKVVLGALPDLSITPFGLTASSDAQTAIHSMTQVINAAIQAATSNQPKVRIADFNAFYAQVISSPSTYNISVTNTATACNLGTMYTTLSAYSVGNPDPSLRTQSSVFCNEIDYVSSTAAQTYAFADSVHPTTAIHQKFAQSVYTDLQGANWK